MQENKSMQWIFGAARKITNVTAANICKNCHIVCLQLLSAGKHQRSARVSQVPGHHCRHLPVNLQVNKHQPLLPVFGSAAPLCRGACVELESDTEAVANKGFKLGCISCKMRGEVRATASINWYFRGSDEAVYSPVSLKTKLIYPSNR